VELRLLDKVFWRVSKLSIEVAYGEWEMGLKLIYGTTHGQNIPDGMVITPRGNIVLSKVEELISPITGDWDEDIVSSAYHGEWKHQFGSRERNIHAPGQSSINNVWDSLWKSSVSAKVKIFA
jgi:hypothetical protein